MTDLSATIAPKSDQLNADDLIVGPKTITITRVTSKPSSEDQPTSIYFEGDNGKPYKPCKSMRRVLIQVWGKDGRAYVGRRMTLYRDPNVMFGGVAVGGIRISHMSHIDEPRTMALTATRASRKPYTVQPLKDDAPVRKTEQTSDSDDGRVRFAGETFDPATPARLAPCAVADMTDRELQDLGRALRTLIERAPNPQAWLDANAEDLDAVKTRSARLHAWITELTSPPARHELGGGGKAARSMMEG